MNLLYLVLIDDAMFVFADEVERTEFLDSVSGGLTPEHSISTFEINASADVRDAATAIAEVRELFFVARPANVEMTMADLSRALDARGHGNHYEWYRIGSTASLFFHRPLRFIGRLDLDRDEHILAFTPNTEADIVDVAIVYNILGIRG